MLKDINFIFGAHIEYNMYKPLHDKLPMKKGVVRSRDLHFKLVTLL